MLFLEKHLPGLWGPNSIVSLALASIQCLQIVTYIWNVDYYCLEGGLDVFILAYYTFVFWSFFTKTLVVYLERSNSPFFAQNSLDLGPMCSFFGSILFSVIGFSVFEKSDYQFMDEQFSEFDFLTS